LRHRHSRTGERRYASDGDGLSCSVHGSMDIEFKSCGAEPEFKASTATMDLKRRSPIHQAAISTFPSALLT
jgi:hypothetical protein